uniref:Uncharacterized protein n=1 Tax=Romanomermis culicivorax TaxID=13658 RepID=A0A915KF77_ROMCU
MVKLNLSSKLRPVRLPLGQFCTRKTETINALLRTRAAYSPTLKPTTDYDYKVEYFKGKDNPCADFLSRKDDGEKPPILNTEDLTTEIFRKNFRSADAFSDADLTVPDILPAVASQPMEIEADVNAVT